MVLGFQIEMEFGNVGFWGEGKTGVPGEKPQPKSTWFEIILTWSHFNLQHTMYLCMYIQVYVLVQMFLLKNFQTSLIFISMSQIMVMNTGQRKIQMKVVWKILKQKNKTKMKHVQHTYPYDYVISFWQFTSSHFTSSHFLYLGRETYM